METFETVQCPVCGALMELGLDTTMPQQFFTIDCEVCCRPFEVRAECESGVVVRLEAGGEQQIGMT